MKLICKLCRKKIANRKEAHNAEPLAVGICCEYCHYTKVVAARLDASIRIFEDGAKELREIADSITDSGEEVKKGE